ncbi:hypothetical protein ACFFIS_04210 [Virgibacillus soli]
MQHKHPIINRAYHFFCEAILIYLSSLMIFYWEDESIPTAVFIIVAGILSLVFSLVSVYKENYAWFMLTVPFTTFTFILFHVNPTISIIYALVLTWRYIVLAKMEFIEREITYLKILFILSLILGVITDFTQDIIFLTILQIVVLLIGYISSHILTITKNHNMYNRTWLLMGGGLAGTALALYIISNHILKGLFVIWDTIIGGLIYIMSLPLYIFELINMDFLSEFEFKRNAGDGLLGMIQNLGALFHQPKKALMEKNISLIYWVLMVILAFIVVSVAMRYIHKRYRRFILKTDQALSAYQLGEKDTLQFGTLSKRMQNIFSKRHPVRRLVYEFERKTTQKGIGRKHFETLDEWFEREGFAVHTVIYNKVRYGEQDVSEHEIERLMTELNAVLKMLKNKGGNK